jgi:hypothetical protein
LVSVDVDLRQRTRNTTNGPLAGAWWGVENLAISGGLALYYQLTARTDNPSTLRDARGRTALEAFASLRFDDMAGALDRYRESLMGVAGSAWNQEPALAAIDPLVTFVRKFGPVGVGWGMEFTVLNPDADRVSGEFDRARRASGEFDQAMFRDLDQRSWTVSFWGHGPGRGAPRPSVQRQAARRELPWADRVRIDDDGLPKDHWRALVTEHRDLMRTLELVEAIARADQYACRHAIRAFYPGDTELWVGPPMPFGSDPGRAITGFRPTSGRMRPFEVPAHQVDWVIYAKLLLAGLIGRQVDFAMPVVELAHSNHLGLSWRAASLLEVIYLELLDHVQRREAFGIARCRDCGGPILRTRRAETTRNRWHPGCQGGRVRRWRVEHPERRRRGSPGGHSQPNAEREPWAGMTRSGEPTRPKNGQSIRA